LKLDRILRRDFQPAEKISKSRSKGAIYHLKTICYSDREVSARRTAPSLESMLKFGLISPAS
jgi:hypothetical protein